MVELSSDIDSKADILSSDNTTLGCINDFPTGPIKYTLRNDYMFKAVLQKNKKALTGLLSALLSMPVEDIVDVDIMNPIELGETIDKMTREIGNL